MSVMMILVAVWMGGSADNAADQTPLARHFGFGPMQIYKINPGTSEMHLADLNGDGKTDAVLWNRHKNRIELFYQPGPATQARESEPTRELNEVPDRGNLVHDWIPIPHRLASLDVADLTGDGRTDLVYFGEPREIVILPGKEGGGFGPPIRMRATAGDPRSGGLAVGDFDSDGHSDVALRGDKQILLFLQKAGGGLARPRHIVHGVDQTLMLMPADVDGDGHDDLLMSVDDNEYGLRVFVQDASGALGAMRRVAMPQVRSITVGHNRGRGDDIYCVESATNRLRVLRWETPAGAGNGDWPLLLYSYPVTGKGKQRPVAVGDATGDGVTDVVAAARGSAQLVLFKGNANGLEPPVAYPGLAKTDDVQIADIDGDGVPETLSISREEKMVGVSHYKNGRLTFPAPLETAGQPLAMTAGKLRDGDDGASLVYLSEELPIDAGKKHPKPITRFHIIDGRSREQKQVWTVTAIEDEPSGLRLADVNQDGLADILLFVPFSPLTVYLQHEDGSFAALDSERSRSGLVKQASLQAMALADVDGDGRAELLLAQQNLARALRIVDGVWTVVDQYNPENADADITGLAVVHDGAGAPTITLYDRASKSVVVMRPGKAKTYVVDETVAVGSFNLTAMTDAGIGRDGEPALVLADVNRLGLLFPKRAAPTLVEYESFETKIKDAWLADAVLGDVNHDGVRDVVAVDMRKAYLQLLTTRTDGTLAEVMHFQVFQGKRFRNEPDRGGEPHQVLIGDVTGDEIDDIVVLCHDRLLVYPGQ